MCMQKNISIVLRDPPVLQDVAVAALINDFPSFSYLLFGRLNNLYMSMLMAKTLPTRMGLILMRQPIRRPTSL